MLSEDQQELSRSIQDATCKRTATALHLWATGVGAVISGDFFGWQEVLVHGFGSGLIALCFATVLYLLLSQSVAELASVLEEGAGPCHFAQTCFGIHVAFVTGLAEALKCVVVIAVVVTGIGSYLVEIFQCPPTLAPVVWLGFIIAFTGLNAAGAEISSHLQFFITSISISILLIFYVGSTLVGLDLSKYAAGDANHLGVWAATSVPGILRVCPFAQWFYLGMEELPLAMEITINPKRNMPLGINFTFVTLMALAFLTFFISSSIPPGVSGMADTAYPLLTGFQYVFGNTNTTRWACLFLVFGLIASLHSFIFSSGQLIAQMASTGYFPAFLGHKSRAGTPIYAYIAGSTAAYTINTVLYFVLAEHLDRLGSVAIAMCLFCTLISYAIQMACFLYLRLLYPGAQRSFHSRCGKTGAILALVLCAISFGGILYLSTFEVYYSYGILLAAALLVGSTLLREVAWNKWSSGMPMAKASFSALEADPR